MCTSVFGCVPVFMRVVGRGGSRLSYSLPPCLLLFQTWSLTELGARLTVGRPQQPSLLPTPPTHTGVTGKNSLAGHLCQSWGFVPRFPHCPSKHSYPVSITLAPRTSFSKLSLDVAFGMALCSLLYLIIALYFH